jgi:hypothetical protein
MTTTTPKDPTADGREEPVINMRAPEYYEYIIVENGSKIEVEWQLVGVYGGQIFNWMVFRRYVEGYPDKERSIV